MHESHEVELHVTGKRRAHFRCPCCDHKLNVTAAFPLSFTTKLCPNLRCRAFYFRVDAPKDHRTAEDGIVGAHTVQIYLERSRMLSDAHRVAA